MGFFCQLSASKKILLKKNEMMLQSADITHVILQFQRDCSVLRERRKHQVVVGSGVMEIVGFGTAAAVKQEAFVYFTISLVAESLRPKAAAVVLKGSPLTKGSICATCPHADVKYY